MGDRAKEQAERLSTHSLGRTAQLARSEQLKALHARGRTNAEIALALNIARRQVGERLRALGLTANPEVEV